MVTWTFVELDDVGSTQTIAKRLAAEGSPEGTAVVAKSQSSGEGRLGRKWVSPTGGLYMSFVLRPRGLVRPELVTLVSAVSVVEGIQRATGIRTAIRWPNDIMSKGRKLAGVIAEAQSDKQEIVQIVVGVGVNCNSPVSGPNELRDEATSLSEELGRRLDISWLRHCILYAFSQLYENWQDGQDIVPLWKQHVATLGKNISMKLKTEETLFSYYVQGIDSEGNLVVAKEGETKIVRAEDLEWLREQS